MFSLPGFDLFKVFALYLQEIAAEEINLEKKYVEGPAAKLMDPGHWLGLSGPRSAAAVIAEVGAAPLLETEHSSCPSNNMCTDCQIS